MLSQFYFNDILWICTEFKKKFKMYDLKYPIVFVSELFAFVLNFEQIVENWSWKWRGGEGGGGGGA